jgi:hypothetical protein
MQLLNHTSGICLEALGAPNDGTRDYILGHTGDARAMRGQPSWLSIPEAPAATRHTPLNTPRCCARRSALESGHSKNNFARLALPSPAGETLR